VESDDSRVSDVGLATADPMEDAPDDDSELFCNVPARRQDFEIVLRAAPLGNEEEECSDERGFCYSVCRALGPI
jgi:hypothetical protein